jgi:hypothetical protein
MAVQITDAASLGAGYCAVLNNSIQATGPQTPETAGFQMLGSEVNPAGSGVGRVTKEIEASEDYRLRSGVDAILFGENFMGSALYSRNWLAPATTFTVSVGAGALTLNAGAVTTANAVVRVQSQPTFRIWGGGPLYSSWDYIYPPAAPVANNTFEMGPHISAGTAAPTDGCFFRYNATGTVECVVCYNSIETSATITAPTSNVRHRCLISEYDDTTNFWIDDVLVASIPTPTGRGTAVSAGALPITFRTYNAATPPGQAVAPQIYAVNVSQGDYGGNARTPEMTNVCMGGMGISSQAGATVAQTANYANSAAPASATLSNTAAGYTTLGGQWQFVTVAGAETDYALFAYQVPALAANLNNKRLVIRGIEIAANNTGAAVATTDTQLQWGIGIGSTAVSLATADAATTKAPHRATLGTQGFAIGAAIGAPAEPLSVKFASPLVANPGEFVHIILKMPRGTNTASQIIRGTCLIDSEWE